ncbi:MAG: hypothetical protein C0600_01445 [Ignavibacteria bacterium]|nr:MAG: hypothetical protein C0600_01445 [Ignavibacteria bacterium]
MSRILFGLAFITVSILVTHTSIAQESGASISSPGSTGEVAIVTQPQHFHPVDSATAVGKRWAPLTFSVKPGTPAGESPQPGGRFAIMGADYPRENEDGSSNEVMYIGWNPLGALRPDMPGFWRNFEFNYQIGKRKYFETNLDVRDASSLGQRRIQSTKINRGNGRGQSWSVSVESFEVCDPDHDAGSGQGVLFSVSEMRTRVERGMEVGLRILNDIDTSSVGARATVALGMGHFHRWHLRESQLSINVEPDTRLRGRGGMTSTLALHNESESEATLTWNRRMFWEGRRISVLQPGEVCLVTITQIGQMYLYASAVSVSSQ